MEFFEQEEGTNIKEFIFRLLSKWHWFVLCGFIGICLGFLFSKSSPSEYNLNASVLINDESKSMGLDDLFDSFDLRDKANIENHILMLQSYTLNRQALENLNREVSWFKSGLLKDTELYGSYPFKVKINDREKNLSGIEIEITPIDNKSYRLSADGKYQENDLEMDVAFEVIGKYDKAFTNQFFDFVISKNESFVRDPEDEYYFKINNLDNLTKLCLRNLNVSLATKKADGIVITYKGNIPQRDVDYLNELIRVYMNYGLNEKNRTSENTVQFIDAQLQGIVDSLNIAGDRFTKFRSENGIVDLSKEAELVAETIEKLEEERELARRQLSYFKNLQAYMGNSEQMKHMVAPSVVGIVDAGLNAQVVKLGELYGKRSSLSVIAKDKNPGLVMIDKEIVMTLAGLEENVNNLIVNAKINLNGLDRRMKKIKLELTSLPQTEQQLIDIKRRFDLNNELYTFLLQKRAEAAITTASNVSDAQVLDPARVETADKIGPKTIINLLIGAILGGVIPFIVIVVGDYFNDSIQSKEDIEKDSKLPIMGEITHNHYTSELAIVKHPRSGIAESFRGLRTNLQYMFKQKKDCKVLALHSMIPGEGKTFNAVNLATIIAMDSKKVLLVSCDLRRPRLNKIFGDNNKSGLSTYLIGQHSLKQVIETTDIKNLSYVNSGPIPPNPSELLGTEEFARFVEEAKKDYDYIVMDNAPVSLVTDGLLTGKYADANLFVLRQGYSNKSQIKFINQMAEKESISQIGIVFNDAMYNAHGYDKNYGYGYGNGYYDEDMIKHNWHTKLLSKFSKN